MDDVGCAGEVILSPGNAGNVRSLIPGEHRKDVEKHQFLLFLLIFNSFVTICCCLFVRVVHWECNVLHKNPPIAALGGARIRRVSSTDTRLSHCRSCRLSGFAGRKLTEYLLSSRSFGLVFLCSRIRLLHFSWSGGRRYFFSDVHHRTLVARMWIVSFWLFPLISAGMWLGMKSA